MTRIVEESDVEVPMVSGVVISDEPPKTTQSLPVTSTPMATAPTSVPPTKSAPPTTVPTASVAVQNTARLRLGRTPAHVACPYCNQDGVTIVRSRPDCATWVTCILLVLLFWPVCWLPFVIPGCKSDEHVCSKCGRLLSTTRGCS